MAIYYSERGFDSLINRKQQVQAVDHFTRCKQHWSRSTSCFSL